MSRIPCVLKNINININWLFGYTGYTALSQVVDQTDVPGAFRASMTLSPICSLKTSSYEHYEPAKGATKGAGSLLGEMFGIVWRVF